MSIDIVPGYQKSAMNRRKIIKLELKFRKKLLFYRFYHLLSILAPFRNLSLIHIYILIYDLHPKQDLKGCFNMIL